MRRSLDYITLAYKDKRWIQQAIQPLLGLAATTHGDPHQLHFYASQWDSTWVVQTLGISGLLLVWIGICCCS